MNNPPRAGAETDVQFEVHRLRRQLEQQHRVLARATAALHASRPDGKRQRTIRVEPRRAAAEQRSRSCGGTWKTDAVPWWPSTAWPAPMRPSPGFAFATMVDLDASVFAVSVFGLSGDALAQAVDFVANLQQRTRSLVPVFLTDCPDPSVFLGRGYASEYFPSAVYRSGDGRFDREKMEARLVVIRRKWNIADAMELSAAADRQPAAESRPGDAAAERVAPADPEVARRTANTELVHQAERIRTSGLFDEAWYLRNNPDVAQSGLDPIMHYLETGAAEGRDPHPLFRTTFYARQMIEAEVKARGDG